MAKIVDIQKIKDVLRSIDPIQEIEDGFIAFSRGDVVVPPVGEMIFEDPPGDVHIKYGFIKEDDYYVIKIASGFYNNPKMGLPSYDGLMLLFNQKTGELISVMLDEGHLTNVRTAAAGAVVAKYLSPKKVNRIGIFGAGVQGRMQLEYLKGIIDCTDVIVWGIDKQELDDYKKEMEKQDFKVETTLQSEDITSSCNFIVTCTPSTKPLIKVDQIEKGVHITAMGSDTPEKQELDSAILRKADRVVVDSIEQVLSRGESYHALKSGMIKKEDLIELGTIIPNETLHRQSDDEITIADLTGVAVQDIQITKAVWNGIAFTE
ncbi:MAG: ornithine cyclodeaminase family protein [Candidatus Heimdallarchaeota archaeon]|nr:ornithine cyclodeaminase family protein [Candidatus Heimdallarchaeota archaeon]